MSNHANQKRAPKLTPPQKKKAITWGGIGAVETVPKQTSKDESMVGNGVKMCTLFALSREMIPPAAACLKRGKRGIGHTIGAQEGNRAYHRSTSINQHIEHTSRRVCDGAHVSLRMCVFLGGGFGEKWSFKTSKLPHRSARPEHVRCHEDHREERHRGKTIAVVGAVALRAANKVLGRGGQPQSSGKAATKQGETPDPSRDRKFCVSRLSAPHTFQGRAHSVISGVAVAAAVCACEC